jgi:cytochrome d ubiquinol oxidase subunit I
VVVYFALFGAGLGYMMRLVRKGPKIDEGKETPEGGPGKKRTPARPLSAADDSADDDHDPSLTKEI